MKSITIHTDGAASGNPGPGGFGVVLTFNEARKKISGGFLHTTNNRMELLAAIVGLESLREPCAVSIYSDSRYLVNAMTKGWMTAWKQRGWARPKQARLRNVDLWKRLDSAVSGHEVAWHWLKGHAGHSENELCDELAVAASQQDDLPEDDGYLSECERDRQEEETQSLL